MTHFISLVEIAKSDACKPRSQHQPQKLIHSNLATPTWFHQIHVDLFDFSEKAK